MLKEKLRGGEVSGDPDGPDPGEQATGMWQGTKGHIVRLQE